MTTVSNRFGSVQWERVNCDELRQGISEHHDCTVRTYTLLTGVDYPFAHGVLASLGRVSFKAFPFARVIDWDQSFERVYPIQGGIRSRMTIGKFVREHPTGKYAVRINGHVFPVINGVIHDALIPTVGQTVKSAWRYK